MGWRQLGLASSVVALSGIGLAELGGLGMLERRPVIGLVSPGLAPLSLASRGFALAWLRVWGYIWPGVSAAVRKDVRPAERPAGRPAGRSSVAPVSSAAPKNKHLIEAAPFGRLDQMLRTTV